MSIALPTSNVPARAADSPESNAPPDATTTAVAPTSYSPRFVAMLGLLLVAGLFALRIFGSA